MVEARCYQITVRGRLSEHFAAAFGGMRLESQPGQTVLAGWVADQAHLYGVLDRLRDFGLELLRLEQVTDERCGGQGDAARPGAGPRDTLRASRRGAA